MRADLPPSLLAAAAALEARFGERIVERKEFRGELTLSVAPEAWLDILTFCRDEVLTAFDQLDSRQVRHVLFHRGLSGRESAQ